MRLKSEIEIPESVLECTKTISNLEINNADKSPQNCSIILKKVEVDDLCKSGLDINNLEIIYDQKKSDILEQSARQQRKQKL